MSKLILSGAASDLKLFQYKADNPQHLNNQNRSYAVSPQRSRFNVPPRRNTAAVPVGPVGAGVDGGAGAGKNSPSSNRQSSPLHRVRSNPEPKIEALITIDELDDLVPKTDTTVGDCGGAAALNFTDKQYLNILHRMGKSVHIFDLDGSIIYWNRTAEETYGYQASEVIGRDVTELLADDKDHDALNEIIQRVRMGESWNGQFPIQTKTGERFAVKVTNTPFYDDNGTLVGVICVSNDSLEFQDMKAPLPGLNLTRDSSLSKLKNTLGLDPQHPLSAAITSKISDLTSLVNSKVGNTFGNSAQSEGGSRDGLHSGYPDVLPSNQSEDVISSGSSSIPSGDMPQSFFSVDSQGLAEEKSLGLRDSGYESEGSLGVEKSMTSKAEEWIASKGMSWPWKGVNRNGSGPKSKQFVWPWSNNDEGANSKTQMVEVNQPRVNEVTGSWFSSCNVNSSDSVSSCESPTSGSNKVDCESDNSDCDILWEDLTVGEQIGQGSCGTVYHALWYGSDVAVKVFSRQEYSDDVIFSFKEEVSLMKRLRHPNVLLFMGVVTSLERLCIITELLPRGSLFRLLQRNATKLDMKRRVQMAIDIARGMNYLHRYNPPIIHRDLKSSNLMVDKNWTVKVGDFGLSRLKHGTYLSTSTGKGTPQWMAPEVLRNEPSDEKCDIYSYGVVLWELVTEKVPWESLNQMQVIGAVGFVNQRLEIPKDVDPQWTALILSCWQSEPQLRPSFQELLDKFKDLQRYYAGKAQPPRASAADSNHNKV